MTPIEREQKYDDIAGHFEKEKQNTLAMLLLNNLKTTLHLASTKINEVAVDQNIGYLTSVADDFLTDWFSNHEHGLAEREFYKQLGVTLTPVKVSNGQYRVWDLNINPNEAFIQLLEGSAPIRLFKPADEELEICWLQYQHSTTLL